MKYIEHGKGGDVDCMTLADGPAPTPGPGQILIEVACAGVNRPDVLQRSGKYPPPPDASPVLGLEVAGTVAALGDGVTDWKVGDGVTALAPGGGYAEYCVAAAGHALPIPAGMDFATAAALPETWFTVWPNIWARNASSPSAAKRRRPSAARQVRRMRSTTARRTSPRK